MPLRYFFATSVILSSGLIAICFTNWTYHPDIDQYFTGFFSANNVYGKPAKFIIPLVLLSFILTFFYRSFIATFVRIFITGILLAYNVKNFILFSSCNFGFCPKIKIGLYLLLSFSIALFISAFLTIKNPLIKR